MSMVDFFFKVSETPQSNHPVFPQRMSKNVDEVLVNVCYIHIHTELLSSFSLT